MIISSIDLQWPNTIYKWRNPQRIHVLNIGENGFSVKITLLLINSFQSSTIIIEKQMFFLRGKIKDGILSNNFQGCTSKESKKYRVNNSCVWDSKVNILKQISEEEGY